MFTIQLMAIHLVSRRDLQCCWAQVIQDIDQQGSWHSGDVSQALSEAVTKVASIARELYLPCKDGFWHLSCWRGRTKNRFGIRTILISQSAE